jgi:hypothetical protein
VIHVDVEHKNGNSSFCKQIECRPATETARLSDCYGVALTIDGRLDGTHEGVLVLNPHDCVVGFDS